MKIFQWKCTAHVNASNLLWGERISKIWSQKEEDAKNLPFHEEKKV